MTAGSPTEWEHDIGSQLQGGRATLSSRRAPLSLEEWLREGGPADWWPVKLCTVLCHMGPGPRDLVPTSAAFAVWLLSFLGG